MVPATLKQPATQSRPTISNSDRERGFGDREGREGGYKGKGGEGEVRFARGDREGGRDSYRRG